MKYKDIYLSCPLDSDKILESVYSSYIHHDGDWVKYLDLKCINNILPEQIETIAYNQKEKDIIHNYKNYNIWKFCMPENVINKCIFGNVAKIETKFHESVCVFASDDLNHIKELLDNKEREINNERI